MKALADGVWQLRGMPPNLINVYLVDDVLVDAASRWGTRRVLRQLEGRPLSAHALTHAHSDHQGASHAVCEHFGVPFWVGANDVDAAERPALIGRRPDNRVNHLAVRMWAGPGHPVARALREGDEVAGFRVLETPGHSAGHISLWRESDRVLVLGDVINNIDTVTGAPGLHEPKGFLTPDPALNRRSAKRLGELEPALVLFGHGAPLRDTARFVGFCAGLGAGPRASEGS